MPDTLHDFDLRTSIKPLLAELAARAAEMEEGCLPDGDAETLRRA
jgi:hypothetical protein